MRTTHMGQWEQGAGSGGVFNPLLLVALAGVSAQATREGWRQRENIAAPHFSGCPEDAGTRYILSF